MQSAKTAITTPQIAGGLSEYCVGGLLKAGYILRHQLRSPAAKPFRRLRVIRGEPLNKRKRVAIAKHRKKKAKLKARALAAK
jgi:flagellar biogenesis protein FliO